MNESDQGIYVATLRSDEWVPVTQDPRYVDTCARVNRSNVKIGKARSFTVRERNYQKDFGSGNVLFAVVAITSEFHAAETAVLRALKQHRKLSPKKRMMDWLENISVDRAVAIAGKALIEAGIPHKFVYEARNVKKGDGGD